MKHKFKFGDKVIINDMVGLILDWRGEDIIYYDVYLQEKRIRKSFKESDIIKPICN